MRPSLKENRSDTRESRPCSHRRGYRKENTSTETGTAKVWGGTFRMMIFSLSFDLSRRASRLFFSHQSHKIYMTRPVVIVTGASRFDYSNTRNYLFIWSTQRYRIGCDKSAAHRVQRDCRGNIQIQTPRANPARENPWRISRNVPM